MSLISYSNFENGVHMNSSKIALLVAAASGALSSCGGRDARAIAETTPNDALLTCEQIKTEIVINNKAIIGLYDERAGDRAQTAVSVVASVVFLPTLFFMDLKGGAANEIKAYSRRNQALAKRHELKNCDPPLQAAELALPDDHTMEVTEEISTDE